MIKQLTVDGILKKGDKVMVRPAWGTQPPEPAVITGYGCHKGKMAYDYRDKNGNERWGYDYQFSKGRDE